MVRGPCTFRQSDIARAIRAVQAAGLQIAGVKISETGAIEVVTGAAPAQDSAADGKGEANEWDRV
jgi:hypothetical protein